MTRSEVEERLRALEVHQEVQEELIRGIHAERIESERLQASVIRLGRGATSLGEALLQVDKNQQTLTKLGAELKQVKDQTATKEELADASKTQHAAAVELRRNALQRVYMTAILVVVIGAVAGLIWYQYQNDQRRAAQDVCEARNGQNGALVKLMEGVLTAPRPNPTASPSPAEIAIRESLAEFKVLIVDCSKL